MSGAVNKRQEKFPDKPWTPRIWAGMHFGGWWRLLRRHGFRVSWQRIPMAGMVALMAIGNSVLGTLERWFYGRRIARTEIEHAPLAILGHWRSGTTHLHEVLSRDPQFIYPNTFQCFAPHHFLLSQWWLAPLMNFLMPRQRLVDKMPMGMKRPQEDEFAMINLGQRSQFLMCAFPNDEPLDDAYLELTDLPDDERRAWEAAWVHFLKRVSFGEQKRLALKSPQHTCRIPVIQRLFPDARFAYLVRNPYAVIPSTLRLMQAMYLSQGLQVPHFARLEDDVFANFQRMHECVEAGQVQLEENRFCVVRFEDLVQNPREELDRLYRRLELGNFDAAWPRLERYLASVAQYRPRRHTLENRLRARIARECSSFLEQHGYDDSSVSTVD